MSPRISLARRHGRGQHPPLDDVVTERMVHRGSRREEGESGRGSCDPRLIALGRSWASCRSPAGHVSLLRPARLRRDQPSRVMRVAVGCPSPDRGGDGGMSEPGPGSADRGMATEWLRTERFRAESLAGVNEALVSACRISRGFRVLEIGAGTGETTQLAADRVGSVGSVTAVDRSSSMLDALVRRVRAAGQGNVTAVAAAVEDVDLPDRSFDAAIGRYVLMLLADPTAVLAKVRRSLRPGARAALAVFGRPERNPLFSVPTDVFRRHLGVPAERLGAPGLFRLGDVDVLERVFIDAGYQDVQILVVSSAHRFQTVAEARDVIAGFPFIRDLQERLGAEEKAAAWREVQEFLDGSVSDSVVGIPGESLVGSGAA
jgi:SAM-dependent methyltransferase